MKRYNDSAIVIRTYKLNEADRIVVFLTEQNGKVRAVAKGVRKMKSRFGSMMEPVNHLTLQLHKGRGELDFVVEVQALNQFPKIRSRLTALDSAHSILEAVDAAAIEGRPKPRLFQMALGALNFLESSSPDDGLRRIVVPAFYLKLLALEGFMPVLGECVICSSKGPLVKLDMEEGGVCCKNCGAGPGISTASQNLMHQILNGGLNQVLGSSHPARLEKETARLALALMEHRFEKGLKAGRNYVELF